jgi:hypothetical protein
VIHYHGSPLGGRKQDASVFYAGRHAMVSFANPDDMSVIAEVCQSFVLDNGAFSLWSKGEAMDDGAVALWYDQWRHHPNCDWVLIPDLIDGSEEQNNDLITLYRGRNLGHLGVPVWHLHETLEKLEWLVDEFRRVALGSSGQWSTPGTAGWWRRMAEAMDVACDKDGRPLAKLHGLRMLDPAIFYRLPLASADSCNAAINSGSVRRFGQYCPPSAAQRAVVIAERIEAHNSAPTWQRDGQLCLFEDAAFMSPAIE